MGFGLPGEDSWFWLELALRLRGYEMKNLDLELGLAGWGETEREDS